MPLLLGLLLLATLLPAQSLPTGDRFLAHLNNELLPFWLNPAAFGTPQGAYPTTRCNDGTAVNFQRPCPEVGRNGWLTQQQHFLVAQSRQTYAYGVAFHLTGEARYLELMKSGVDFIRNNMVDRRNGGLFVTRSLPNGQWGPSVATRNPQELAYGLLGMSFYYYLTRDADTLYDIMYVRDHILGKYYNPNTNALRWHLTTNPEDKRLVAQLDQLNAYMILLTPTLPEPYQTESKQALSVIANLMIEQFYSPQDNLFFLTANKPEEVNSKTAATDFGHTIKAMWMIRYTGLLTGETNLLEFAETNGPKVLARAYQQSNGAWASGVKQGGELDLDKSWWIYAELDQFAATMAINNKDTAKYLERTYTYWFDKFVDPTYGEVWTTVLNATGKPPADDLPKQWPWKNGYHSLEHALVGYITSQQLNNQPVTLYYAHNPQSNTHPYYYVGHLTKTESITPAIWRAEFKEVH